jgi:hypothetical protein
MITDFLHHTPTSSESSSQRLATFIIERETGKISSRKRGENTAREKEEERGETVAPD